MKKLLRTLRSRCFSIPASHSSQNLPAGEASLFHPQPENRGKLNRRFSGNADAVPHEEDFSSFQVYRIGILARMAR